MTPISRKLLRLPLPLIVGMSVMTQFPALAQARMIPVMTEQDILQAQITGLGSGDILRIDAPLLTLTQKLVLQNGVVLKGKGKTLTVTCPDETGPT